MSLKSKPPLRALEHLNIVWAVRPQTNRELFTLALELGNLHVPVEIAGGELLVAPDGPVAEVLERMNLPYESRRVKIHGIAPEPYLPLTPRAEL